MTARALLDVEHIEERVGPHGGKYWRLRLSCGHSVARGVPKFRFGTRPRLAPRRAKCLLGCMRASVQPLAHDAAALAIGRDTLRRSAALAMVRRSA